VSVAWLAEAREAGALSARVGRDGDRLVAEWPRRARFSVRRDGSDVVFDTHPEADLADVEKLRRGAVRLLLAHLRGAIPLHASAVAIEGRAVVCVGGTGLGKSTLAATLCDLAGGCLLGDDAVAVERNGDSFEVLALDDEHWLDAPAARALGRPSDFGDDKVALATRRSDVKCAPLAMIVHLAFSKSGEPRLVPVLGLEAVAGLLAQLTRFVVDEPEVARRDLSSLADLVDRTPVVRLERPRRLDLLRATADLVAAALHGETS
jgi:hypothetical protein